MSVANTIIEAGAHIKAIVTTHRNDLLDEIPCENLLIGDFEDVESFLQEGDLVISNFHAERLAIKHKKALLVRGFPDFESLGNQLKNDVLYEGSSYLLFELANLINHHKLGAGHEH